MHALRTLRASRRVASLRVTWHRWRSQHSIRHSQKPHATGKLHGSVFYKTGVIANWSHIAGLGTFALFAAVTLTLTRWPSYTNVTRVLLRYPCRPKWTFYVQAFESYRSSPPIHTYRQTDREMPPKITTPLRREGVMRRRTWSMEDSLPLATTLTCCWCSVETRSFSALGVRLRSRGLLVVLDAAAVVIISTPPASRPPISTRSRVTCITAIQVSHCRQWHTCTVWPVVFSLVVISYITVFKWTYVKQLHWLPIEWRIRFKLATLTFKALHTGRPPYLSDLLQHHEPMRSLRSSSSHQLSVPHHNISVGSRAFRFSAPPEPEIYYLSASANLTRFLLLDVI